MPNKNANLHGAKRAKNDEFYTRLEDIEKELAHYHGAGRNPFRGKVVYLNCDDPDRSQFWTHFARMFDELELSELVATGYVPGGRGVGRRLLPGGVEEPVELDGDGDFRSAECVALLQRADIVVSNPPFSLFREYVSQLVRYGVHFLIVGSKNAITYKEIFPLIKDVKMWIGGRPFAGGMWFEVPKGAKVDKVVDGKDMGNVPACWFTNLDHKKRHEELELYRKYAGREDDYPMFDNYDAIEVGKVKDIPYDYDGVMGVPITFLDKFNPDQFEIVGCSYNYGRPDFWDESTRMSPVVNGKPVYKRILIRRK